VTSFAPTYGAVGSSVTLTGTNLSGATGVTIGGGPGVITANTATSVTVQISAGARTGYVTLTYAGGVTASTVQPFVVIGFRPAAGASEPGAPLGLYPNPAHDRVRVQTTGLPANTVLQLLDGTGTVIRTVSLTDADEQVLALTGLRPGFYTVRIGARVERLLVE
jgi:hypothetical protein